MILNSLLFFGRLHPMMVHFPIALLLVALVMELLSGKRENLRSGANLLLYLGTLSAFLAVVMGLVLHKTENYGGELVEYHEWTGILTFLLAGLAIVFLRRTERGKGRRTVYRLSLALSVISLTIAGHLGASLTHGEDYLSGAFEQDTEHDAGKANQLLQDYQAILTTGNFSPGQLDRLNLEVRAIFAHNCYQCHSREKQKGDLILQTEEGVMRGGENGPILIPGQADQSEIIRRLQLPRSDEESMPPKGKVLQKSEIELIALWIEQGAHWADQELKVFPEAELALEKPTLPSGGNELEHPVDRWVDQHFEEHGTDWPEPVDDRTFARRVYLDAIGLLPEPAQLEAFLEDRSPDKRTQLVDQLLADTVNYAQHWLSFWNDLLRNDYSGTGFITGGRKQISQWLYDALLANRSYDQMVRQLVNPNEASEGFIKGIRWRGVVNSSQRTEMQAAQNISQSLMGLNLKCASCHDSFVSNLTLDQAYAFANVFADTALEIHRCDKPTGRMADTRFVYSELGEIKAQNIKEKLAELSQVMVKPENGRLYRTIVNRLWAKLLGRGLIAPVDEMDRAPWSQDLLDWLAADLIDNRYDLKNSLRTIMTSRAYQLPSVAYESVRELNVEDFVFQGPVRRRMSAEQFADAFSQTIYPLYHGVAFDPNGEKLEAEWIWHREIELDRDVLPKPGKRYFRYSFALAEIEELKRAQLLVTADHAFALYLNGEQVAAGSDWWQVETAEITDWLRKGKNVFAVQGVNEGQIPNPAGLLLSLQLEYADGRQERIFSNRDWVSVDSLPEGNWQGLDYEDGDWQRVRRYAGFYNTSWGRLPGFSHQAQMQVQAQAQNTPFVRASLVKLDPFLKAMGRPTRENVTTSRDDWATLLEALAFTNGEFFSQTLQMAAEQWWERTGGDAEDLIYQLYQRTLGRQPNDRELRIALDLLEQEASTKGAEDLIWSVVMLPEFQLIE